MLHENLIEDFEFERRFYCKEIPTDWKIKAHKEFLVQSYLLASDGYNIRVRTSSKDLDINLGGIHDYKTILDQHYDKFEFAFITCKAPMLGGSRYEAEKEIDAGVAIEYILRGGSPIIKNRYNVWIGKDNWIIDEFGADNSGLVIAECERNEPVTNLSIPSFCYTEITEDYRFSNDNLSQNPYKNWIEDYKKELETNKPSFSDQFGENTFI